MRAPVHRNGRLAFVRHARPRLQRAERRSQRSTCWGEYSRSTSSLGGRAEVEQIKQAFLFEPLHRAFNVDRAMSQGDANGFQNISCQSCSWRWLTKDVD